MYGLIISILLTIFLYVQLKKILEKILIKEKSDFERTQREYDTLLSEHTELKTGNSVLAKNLEETIALYDITKQICKSIDENKVFADFRELLTGYVRVNDCKFIKNIQELKLYNDYTVSPLKISKEVTAYLIVDGINNEQDKVKFNILAQQFLLGIKRALLYQKVQELAITDSLTKAFSRRYLMARLNEEIERSKKFKYIFSLLMIDVDHFKGYNDRYGHLVGDAVLREVSGTIKENIRQIDLVGRYGGEEFVVILSETDKAGAIQAAERIRQAVEYRDTKIYDENLKVTVSIGICAFSADLAKESQDFIDRADEALYQAKQQGRNRICVYGG